jgi:hypothetical protein
MFHAETLHTLSAVENIAETVDDDAMSNNNAGSLRMYRLFSVNKSTLGDVSPVDVPRNWTYE